MVSQQPIDVNRRIKLQLVVVCLNGKALFDVCHGLSEHLRLGWAGDSSCVQRQRNCKLASRPMHSGHSTVAVGSRLHGLPPHCSGCARAAQQRHEHSHVSLKNTAKLSHLTEYTGPEASVRARARGPRDLAPLARGSSRLRARGRARAPASAQSCSRPACNWRLPALSVLPLSTIVMMWLAKSGLPRLAGFAQRLGAALLRQTT